MAEEEDRYGAECSSTRDGEDRDLKKRDDSKVPETQALKASKHTNMEQETLNPYVNESSTA